jgi:hypothetical protein
VIVLLALLVVVGVVVARGGSLAALADLRLRLGWFAVLAFAAQVVLFEVVDERVSVGVAAALHVATYVPALVFVAANRTLPGLTVIAAGAALNVLVIAANGGVMPSSAWARDVAGIEETEAGSVRNSGEVDDPVLLPLGDVLAVPGSRPVGAAFSVGDVLLVIGGAVLLVRTCGPRRAGEPDYSTATTSTRSTAPDGAANSTVSPAREPMRD